MAKEILLYVVRHGRTEMNEQHIFRGDADPPLDKNGFKDANQVAYFLEPIDVALIFCSSKIRSIDTAKIICQNRLIEPHIIDGLMPWNVGDFGGLEKTEENVNKLQYYVDNPSIPVPGGDSLDEFRSRVCPLLMDGVDIAFNIGKPILFVVHSSVIHEVGELFGGHHEAAHVKPGGVAAVFIENGRIDTEPIFKADERASTQNILGVKNARSSLSS